MLLFLCIIIIVLVTVIIVLSEIRFNIGNYEYSTNYRTNIKTNNEIKLQLYFVGKIKIFSINVYNRKVSRKFNKNVLENKLKQIKDNIKPLSKIEKHKRKEELKELIRNFIRKIKIKKVKINIEFDTEDPVVTSYLLAVFYTIIPCIIKSNIDDFSKENYQLNITPTYKFTNYFYISLNCIFSIKIVHIINMLILNLFRKERNKKYERSSNRRINANRYGKYKKYDRCKHNNRRTYGNIR